MDVFSFMTFLSKLCLIIVLLAFETFR